MEISEIKEFLNTNKDSDQVKELRNSFTPSFEEAMESDEFKAAIKSYTDRESRRQVESYKSNTFDKAVQDEVSKQIEAKEHLEPWEIKLQEMEKKQNELLNQLKDKERAELVGNNKAKALQILSEKKLPTELVDYFVSDQEDQTLSNIEKVSSVFESYAQNLKQGVLKNNNVQVPGVNTTPSGSNIPKEPGEGASSKDWDAWYTEVRQLKKQSN